MKYIVILLGLFYSFEVFSQQPVIRPTVYADTAFNALQSDSSIYADTAFIGKGALDTANFWQTNGNTATYPNNKIGTTNDADVVFIANNTEVMRIDSSTQNIYIGARPAGGELAKLTINSGIVSISNHGLVLSDNYTANTTKLATFSMPRYASNGAERPFSLLTGFSNTTGNNFVYIGGGTSAGFAATSCKIYTAATSLTSEGIARVNIISNGNIGFGNGTLSSAAVPTYNLSWNGNATYTFGGERHTTANTSGNSTTFRGIGATSGANNKSGGDLIFMSGEKTGVFSNGAIRMQTYGSSAAATADNSSYDRMVILSTEALKDNTLDTLFSVVLGADSVFTSSMKFAVTVMDADSAQMETGDVIFQYLRNGNKGAIATASVTSVKGKEIAGETDVATTFSYIYAHATSTLYVCVKVDTPTGNNLNTYANIGFNGTILGMGGRYTTLTQY